MVFIEAPPPRLKLQTQITLYSWIELYRTPIDIYKAHRIAESNRFTPMSNEIKWKKIFGSK